MVIIMIFFSALLKLYSGIEISQLLREDKYSELLSLLLYIEEHQMEIDIRMYDRDDVTMNEVKQNKKLLSLEVSVYECTMIK